MEQIIDIFITSREIFALYFLLLHGLDQSGVAICILREIVVRETSFSFVLMLVPQRHFVCVFINISQSYPPSFV